MFSVFLSVLSLLYFFALSCCRRFRCRVLAEKLQQIYMRINDRTILTWRIFPLVPCTKCVYRCRRQVVVLCSYLPRTRSIIFLLGRTNINNTGPGNVVAVAGVRVCCVRHTITENAHIYSHSHVDIHRDIKLIPK